MEGKGSFLDELTERLLDDFSGNLEGITIVFPNRRAGLFFTKALASRIDHPVWSPAILNFEDFMYSLSNTTPADNLSLLLDLYDVFTSKAEFKESFDRFYFWGEMLLRDFNEIDKNLVPVKALFTSLQNLKEIDAQFDFLSNEEKKALEHFWGNVLSKKSRHQGSFLKFWASLYPVYVSFRKTLIKSGKAYSGMIYRSIAEDVKSQQFKWNKGKVVFAGFHALIPSEEIIIKWFIDSSLGMIYWDLDQFYFNNPNHEAGMFLRQYFKDPVFRKTFPATVPTFFKDRRKQIHTIASSQYSGQALITGHIIHRLMAEQGPMNMANTVVVFPDESLVSQVLYSLPEGLAKINITMGYQISNSAFYSLFEHVLDLQEKISTGNSRDWFYYRQVLDVLNHHFISGICGESGTDIIKLIEKRNMIFVPAGMLRKDTFLSEIFDPEADQNLFEYLIRILVLVRRSFNDTQENRYFFEKEFSIVFYKLFKRLKDIFSEKNIKPTPTVVKRVLKYYSRFERIPFSGEPLEGLQMMGLLETRNLDFDNVILLCSNEGQLPSSGSPNSFIPFNIRKAFGLPNINSQDAIYSYLFYRLIQRASNIYLIYNTEESVLKPSEPSRYIHQLKFESGFEIQHHWLSMDIAVASMPRIVIQKDDFVRERLRRYFLDDVLRFSPSSLNMYLNCPLNFYYKYILDIKEAADVSEDLDAAKFGNILHHAMHSLYKSYKGRIVTSQIIDSIRKGADHSIQKAFSVYYGQEDGLEFQFEGKNVLGREIIKKYIVRILEKDKEQSPFEILELEKNYIYDLPVVLDNKHVTVGLRGIIDRIDKKDGKVRIIDYKSGKDESTFKSIAALFDSQDEKRNKAIFQTFFYGLLYIQNHPEHENKPLIAGLYNFSELFNQDFDIRIKLRTKGHPSEYIDDILPLLTEYEKYLKNLILEIYDPVIPFMHRDSANTCLFCKRLGMPTDFDK